MIRQIRMNGKRFMNKGRAFLEREDDDGEDDGFVELDTSSFLGSFSVVIILSHLAIGICFYMFAEEWEFRDSLYFCVVTLTTVGYGDMAPSSDISKVFTIFYILLGLSIVATCLGLLVGRVQAKIEACHAQEVSKLGLMLKMVGILVVTTLVGAAYVMVAEGWCCCLSRTPPYPRRRRPSRVWGAVQSQLADLTAAGGFSTRSTGPW
jgi:hypothetical protein